ncbi:MAG TPA: hypothetical protein VKY74_20640 [Chloroflexia bacterium]|nr:hypothetical protein [Chloroflexia bacterium]
MATQKPIRGQEAADPIPTNAPLQPTTLNERELITSRYSAPSARNDRVFRTFEIVYPANATDDEIWQRAQRAVFGVNCLQVLAQSLDHQEATAPPEPPPESPPESVQGSPRLATRPVGGGQSPMVGNQDRPLQGGITEKQLKAIYAIARAARHLSEAEIEAQCQELYHCRPDELSKAAASQLIDSLKGPQAA